MQNQQQACQAVKAVLEASKCQRGGAVAYKPYHVYIVLEAIKSNQPVGRPTLSKITGLGEAPLKTLLNRLGAIGLTEKTPRGHILTSKGWGTLKRLRETIIIGDPPSTPLGPSKSLATPLIPPPSSLVDVYNVRDYIVIEGCRKALIGGASQGRPVFPGVPPEAIANFSDWIPEIDDGLIVIAPLDCIPAAYTGIARLIAEEYCAE